MSCTHQESGRRTPEVDTGAQCAQLFFFKKKEHVGRNALQHQAKFKQLTADACVTFQGMRGGRRGVSHGKNITKGKMKKKGIYSSTDLSLSNGEVLEIVFCAKHVDPEHL